MELRPTRGITISHVPPPKRHPYDQWSPDARALDLVGDKWTLLIVRDLIPGPRRFVELQRVLPGISTEQLRSRLNRMVADGMLTRQRYREVPPRVDYELTERARELTPIIGELARWGYNWAWGQPRPSENIDLGAIFRVIPGLITGGATGVGSVAMTVTDGRGDGPLDYRVNLSAAGATVTACATHAVLSGPAVERIENSSIVEVVFTDSIPLREEALRSSRIKALSVAPLLARAIKSIHEDGSVSTLFI